MDKLSQEVHILMISSYATVEIGNENKSYLARLLNVRNSYRFE